MTVQKSKLSYCLSIRKTVYRRVQFSSTGENNTELWQIKKNSFPSMKLQKMHQHFAHMSCRGRWTLTNQSGCTGSTAAPERRLHVSNSLARWSSFLTEELSNCVCWQHYSWVNEFLRGSEVVDISAMSDRKQAREKEDRRDHKRHKTSKEELEKLKTQAKKHSQQVQALKHVDTLWVILVGDFLFFVLFCFL